MKHLIIDPGPDVPAVRFRLEIEGGRDGTDPSLDLVVTHPDGRVHRIWLLLLKARIPAPALMGNLEALLKTLE